MNCYEAEKAIAMRFTASGVVDACLRVCQELLKLEKNITQRRGRDVASCLFCSAKRK